LHESMGSESDFSYYKGIEICIFLIKCCKSTIHGNIRNIIDLKPKNAAGVASLTFHVQYILEDNQWLLKPKSKF